MDKLNYFGTDCRSAGHYFWVLDGVSQYGGTLDGFRHVPFNPEDFTKIFPNPNRPESYTFKPKGDVEIHRIGDYSILAIAGSPIDGRQGCKSIFFWKEKLSDEQLIEKVKSLPIAMKIINQMPFPVKYFKRHENISQTS